MQIHKTIKALAYHPRHQQVIIERLQEGLKEFSQTQHDLIEDLQTILEQLAYYITNSETAISDCREEWRDSAVDQMRSNTTAYDARGIIQDVEAEDPEGS